MLNQREHVNLPLKRVKCIVFDQDGTFYSPSSDLATVLREKTKLWLMQTLAASTEEMDSLYDSIKAKYPNPFHGFQSLGASVSEYHEHVFDAIDPCNYLTYDTKLVQVLRQLHENMYVVTLASPSYSVRLQKCLGIVGFIKKTYYVKDFAPDYSKKSCYAAIAEGLGASLSGLCVVGDNYPLDIAPALELGCMAVHLSSDSAPGGHRVISTIYDLPRLFPLGKKEIPSKG